MMTILTSTTFWAGIAAAFAIYISVGIIRTFIDIRKNRKQVDELTARLKESDKNLQNILLKMEENRRILYESLNRVQKQVFPENDPHEQPPQQ